MKALNVQQVEQVNGGGPAIVYLAAKGAYVGTKAAVSWAARNKVKAATIGAAGAGAVNGWKE